MRMTITYLVYTAALIERVITISLPRHDLCHSYCHCPRPSDGSLNGQYGTRIPIGEVDTLFPFASEQEAPSQSLWSYGQFGMMSNDCSLTAFHHGTIATKVEQFD